LADVLRRVAAALRRVDPLERVPVPDAVERVVAEAEVRREAAVLRARVLLPRVVLRAVELRWVLLVLVSAMGVVTSRSPQEEGL
jgi:hypothetical protein